MLAVHIAAFFVLFAIYGRAPDWMQRIIVGSFVVAMGIMSAGYIGTIFWGLDCSGVLRLGNVIEHLAVLLYLFRIFISDQEKRCLPNSLQQSQRLPD